MSEGRQHSLEPRPRCIACQLEMIRGEKFWECSDPECSGTVHVVIADPPIAWPTDGGKFL